MIHILEVLAVSLPLQTLVKALIGAIIVALACSLTGVLVVNWKITSIGYCMSHAAFAGAALGFLLSAFIGGFDPQVTILAFTIGTAVILGPLSEKAKLSSEVTLGVLFSLFIALGFTFLALIPAEGAGTRNAMELLWGSIWGLDYLDFLWLALITLVLIVFLTIFFKEFAAITFHEKVATAAGVPTTFFRFFVLCVVALVVSFSLSIVGALLVYAMIILPTSTIHQFVSDFKKLFYYSPIAGLVAAIGGMLITLFVDLPVASSMILVGSVLFLIAVIASPKRRVRRRLAVLPPEKVVITSDSVV